MSSKLEITHHLLDYAHQTMKAHFSNLSLDEALFVPQGGYRSVLGTLKHAAGWSHVYRSYAFDQQPRHWDQLDWPHGLRDTVIKSEQYLQDIIAWFEDAHRRWLADLANVSEIQLDELHLLHWGQRAPLYEIVVRIASHHLYHAGELNQVLSIYRGEAWEETEEVEENNVSTIGHRIRPPWLENHDDSGVIWVDSKTRKHLSNLRSEDRDLQNQAYFFILEQTEKPVDWAYEVWDQLVEGLKHKDNHVRAISAQILANLAKSDPENWMQKDFPALMAVTKDEKFVTARHALQSVWKVGLEKKMQKSVVEALAERFRNCTAEKNWTLIRYDIIQDLRNLYDEAGDESIKQKALELIETEEDAKYKKKYASVWK